MLRYTTAGESHGKCLVTSIEGLPYGTPLDPEAINAELARRQGGYGRGARMKLEKDEADIVTGMRKGRSLGAIVTLQIMNRVQNTEELNPITRPRPGHADLAGAMKFGTNDARDVAERSSARETAARVAAGALANSFLSNFGIRARALMSVQTVKAVEVGLGFEAARRIGSQMHDEIVLGDGGKIARSRNNAGGIEGGMTNGQPVIVRGACKPISTLRKPMQTVDLASKEQAAALYERYDVCVVPAASVIGQAVVAFEIARVFLAKSGADTFDEKRQRYDAYRKQLEQYAK